MVHLTEVRGSKIEQKVPALSNYHDQYLTALQCAAKCVLFFHCERLFCLLMSIFFCLVMLVLQQSPLKSLSDSIVTSEPSKIDKF